VSLLHKFAEAFFHLEDGSSLAIAFQTLKELLENLYPQQFTDKHFQGLRSVLGVRVPQTQQTVVRYDDLERVLQSFGIQDSDRPSDSPNLQFSSLLLPSIVTLNQLRAHLKQNKVKQIEQALGDSPILTREVNIGSVAAPQ